MSQPIKWISLTLVLGLVFAMASCTSKKAVNQNQTSATGNTLRVLTYSSLGAESGFLKSVQGAFKNASGCELSIQTTLDAAQILTELKEHPGTADFVVGIDDLLFERGKSFWAVDDALIRSIKGVTFNPALKQTTESGVLHGFFPLDYGALTFIYRKEAFQKLKLTVPTTVSDLLKPEYRKKFIVQDPRVSSPGLQFFTWIPSTLSLEKLKGQWLTLSQGWDASYQLFLQGEAPMVWSYLSSLAYHETKGQGDQFDFVDFKEGLPVQIEGMAQVIGTAQNPCAQKWLSFVYQLPIQAQLTQKQWMLPVVNGVDLPPAFQKISHFDHLLAHKRTIADVDQLLTRFGKEVQGASW